VCSKTNCSSSLKCSTLDCELVVVVAITLLSVTIAVHLHL